MSTPTTPYTFLKKLGSVRYTVQSGTPHMAAVADDGVTVVAANDVAYPNVQTWVDALDARYTYCEI